MIKEVVTKEISGGRDGGEVARRKLVCCCRRRGVLVVPLMVCGFRAFGWWGLYSVVLDTVHNYRVCLKDAFWGCKGISFGKSL